MVKKIEKWVAEDGTEFNSWTEAERHEQDALSISDLYAQLDAEINVPSDYCMEIAAYIVRNYRLISK